MSGAGGDRLGPNVSPSGSSGHYTKLGIHPASAGFGDPAALLDIATTGAGEGVRTLDPDLGKVVLYH